MTDERDDPANSSSPPPSNLPAVGSAAHKPDMDNTQQTPSSPVAEAAAAARIRVQDRALESASLLTGPSTSTEPSSIFWTNRIAELEAKLALLVDPAALLERAEHAEAIVEDAILAGHSPTMMDAINGMVDALRRDSRFDELNRRPRALQSDYVLVGAR